MLYDKVVLVKLFNVKLFNVKLFVKIIDSHGRLYWNIIII